MAKLHIPAQDRIELERKVIWRAVLSIQAHLLAIVIPIFTTSAFSLDPLFWSGLLLAMCVVLFPRAFLYFIYRKDYAAHSRFMIAFSRVTTAAIGALWSVAVIFLLLKYGVTLPTVLIILSVSMIATGAVISFSFDLIQVLAFLGFALVPWTLTVLFFIERPGFLTIAEIGPFIITYLTILAFRSNTLLFETLSNREVIKNQRDQFQSVVDAIPGFVYWTDRQGKCIGMNRTLTRASLRQNSSTQKESFLEVFQDLQKVKNFYASQKAYDIFESDVVVNSERRAYLVTVTRFENQSGNSILLIILDIEEQKQAQRRLASLQEQAYETSRLAALGTMASGLAHEIRNPMSLMGSAISALRQMHAKNEINSDVLLMAIERTEETHNQILKITKGLQAIAYDTDHDRFETIPLKVLIKETLDFCRSSLAYHTIRLQVDEIPEMVLISCKKNKIFQALINVLINAQEAICNLEDKWIHLSFEILDDRVQIRITDSGFGVPLALQDKLMIPFFSTRTASRNMGLGLSISKAILEDHKGSLALDKNATHTTFVVTLPYLLELPSFKLENRRTNVFVPDKNPPVISP